MIAYLSGQVIAKSTDSIILKAGGVGYLVFATPSLLSAATIDQELECFIYTSVRDDAIDLYGFATVSEQALFKDLISVSGVGAKTAISILSFPKDQIIQAIRSADADFFTNIPRLGRKNAQKIIIELKNKYQATNELNLNTTDFSDLIRALQSMGYSRAEAQQAVKTIPDGVDQIEEQLKIALKSLA